MVNRIKGNRLKLTIDGVDHYAELTRGILENDAAPADVVTFADAASGGGRQFFLNMAAIQSTDAASLWRKVWDHAGEEVDFTLGVHGNEVPTADQPHAIGIVKIGPKPPLGGEASATGRPYTFDMRWECVGEPVLDDGTP